MFAPGAEEDLKYERRAGAGGAGQEIRRQLAEAAWREQPRGLRPEGKSSSGHTIKFFAGKEISLFNTKRMCPHTQATGDILYDTMGCMRKTPQSCLH